MRRCPSCSSRKLHRERGCARIWHTGAPCGHAAPRPIPTTWGCPNVLHARVGLCGLDVWNMCANPSYHAVTAVRCLIFKVQSFSMRESRRERVGCRRAWSHRTDSEPLHTLLSQSRARSFLRSAWKQFHSSNQGLCQSVVGQPDQEEVSLHWSGRWSWISTYKAADAMKVGTSAWGKSCYSQWYDFVGKPKSEQDSA